MPGSNHDQNHWIEAAELARHIGSARAPAVLDVRRPAAIEVNGRVIAGARWRAHSAVQSWTAELDPENEVIIYCVHGHNVSQSAAALLRSYGFRARTLRDGMEGYVRAGGITTAWQAKLHDATEPSCWVTRERPENTGATNRTACSWLIRRFLDSGARILYVEAEHVLPIAEEFAATAFDLADMPSSQHSEPLGFDALLQRFKISDPALECVARIVRGMETAQPDLAPECAGMLALGQGISKLHDSDLAAMEHGFAIYDALYAWARDGAAAGCTLSATKQTTANEDR